jgi:hypothetical protein
MDRSYCNVASRRVRQGLEGIISTRHDEEEMIEIYCD